MRTKTFKFDRLFKETMFWTHNQKIIQFGSFYIVRFLTMFIKNIEIYNLLIK